MDSSRRKFLKNTALTASSGLLLPHLIAAADRPTSSPAKRVRVLIWDERAESEKAYDHFLGNYIAGQLQKDPHFLVTSAGLDDPGQGIADSILDQTDVLMWWGHARQNEITPEKGTAIVERIEAGSLALIALHSAHWSTPFVQAMYEITRMNALKDSPVKEADIHLILPEVQYTVPKYDSRITPYTTTRKFPDGHSQLQVHLPFCCFPAYRNDGKPSTVNVLQPQHPIMAGLPPKFRLAQTEMYDEPFHVPAPDEVLFEESWAQGEWFRSGMLWNLEKGRVFYFRPGHEEYPVFKDPHVLQILSNAAKWLAA